MARTSDITTTTTAVAAATNTMDGLLLDTVVSTTTTTTTNIVEEEAISMSSSLPSDEQHHCHYEPDANGNKNMNNNNDNLTKNGTIVGGRDQQECCSSSLESNDIDNGVHDDDESTVVDEHDEIITTPDRRGRVGRGHKIGLIVDTTTTTTTMMTTPEKEEEDGGGDTDPNNATTTSNNNNHHPPSRHNHNNNHNHHRNKSKNNISIHHDSPTPSKDLKQPYPFTTVGSDELAAIAQDEANAQQYKVQRQHQCELDKLRRKLNSYRDEVEEWKKQCQQSQQRVIRLEASAKAATAAAVISDKPKRGSPFRRSRNRGGGGGLLRRGQSDASAVTVASGSVSSVDEILPTTSTTTLLGNDGINEALSASSSSSAAPMPDDAVIMPRRASSSHQATNHLSQQQEQQAGMVNNNDGAGGTGTGGGKRKSELGDLATMISNLKHQNAQYSTQIESYVQTQTKHMETIDTLKHQNAQLIESQSLKEMEFMNQLSALACDKSTTEQELKEKLRGKIESIKFLREHILNQDEKMVVLEEQFRILNDQLRGSGSGSGSTTRENNNDDDARSISSVTSGRSQQVEEIMAAGGDSDEGGEGGGRRGRSTAFTATTNTTNNTNMITEQDHQKLQQRYDTAVRRIKLIEKTNTNLRNEVEQLSLSQRDSCHEIVELKERILHLSYIETSVVPELQSKLDASRMSVTALEHDIQMVKKDKELVEVGIRNIMSKTKSTKSQMETEFMDQLVEMEAANKEIVQDLQDACQQKEHEIRVLNDKMKSLEEKVIRLESNNELDEITASNYSDIVLSLHQQKQEDDNKNMVPKIEVDKKEEQVRSLQKQLREKEEELRRLSPPSLVGYSSSSSRRNSGALGNMSPTVMGKMPLSSSSSPRQSPRMMMSSPRSSPLTQRDRFGGGGGGGGMTTSLSKSYSSNSDGDQWC